MLWYFRLNSEKEKEMTEEETKDFERKAKCEPIACLLLLVAALSVGCFRRASTKKPFRREEKGIKITLAKRPSAEGAEEAETPPVVRARPAHRIAIQCRLLTVWCRADRSAASVAGAGEFCRHPAARGRGGWAEPGLRAEG